MQAFFEDFFRTIRTNNPNRLMTYCLLRFIVAGLILFALTFLRPLGILIALGVIAFFVYRTCVR